MKNSHAAVAVMGVYTAYDFAGLILNDQKSRSFSILRCVSVSVHCFWAASEPGGQTQSMLRVISRSRFHA